MYHAWGLRGYRYLSTHFLDGSIVFTVEPPSQGLRCSCCGRREVRREGSVTRRWRTTPIGGKPVFVESAVPRLWCAGCGKTRQITPDFAEPKVRYTRACERYALELSRHMTILDVARQPGRGSPRQPRYGGLYRS